MGVNLQFSLSSFRQRLAGAPSTKTALRTWRLIMMLKIWLKARIKHFARKGTL